MKYRHFLEASRPIRHTTNVRAVLDRRRVKRSTLFNTGVKVCPQETMKEVITSHRTYYKLRGKIKCPLFLIWACYIMFMSNHLTVKCNCNWNFLILLKLIDGCIYMKMYFVISLFWTWWLCPHHIQWWTESVLLTLGSHIVNSSIWWGYMQTCLVKKRWIVGNLSVKDHPHGC